jgi:thiamine kinase-like enzyme
MSPEEALELLNKQEKTTYALNAEYSGGEDQGAVRVADAEGNRAVLKTSKNPMWINQIQRAKAATDHLRAVKYPAPVYTAMGSSDRGTYWLQQVLEGAVIEASPTTEQLQNLLNVIELQKEQAISEVQGQDWVWYVMDVVFQGTDGYVRALMQFSPDTSALVSDIEALVIGLQGKVLPKTDIVHGDMNMGQVLYTGQNVTGILDWDQVGYGDRTIDLAALWYSLMGSPEARDAVMQHMQAVSTPDNIKICASYKMLQVVARGINQAGGNVMPDVLQARTALDLLHKI